MSEAMKFEIKDGKLDLAFDGNKDGQAVVKVKLDINEAIQEAMSRGAKVEGVKIAAFGFVGTKLMLKLDTDQDGQTVAEIEIDLMEAYDEASTFKLA